MNLKSAQNPAITDSWPPPITRGRKPKRHLPTPAARKSCHLTLPAYPPALISGSLKKSGHYKISDDELFQFLMKDAFAEVVLARGGGEIFALGGRSTPFVDHDGGSKRPL